MPDAVLSPRQRHTWRERANGKICIEMLAERTDLWFPPSESFESVGRPRQRGETRLAIWQACREFGRNSIFNMWRRRLQTCSWSARHFARIEIRKAWVVGRRIAAALYAMRAIGTSCHTDWRGDIQRGHPCSQRHWSVCPIHRAISILFEDDAVLFETRTTAALSVPWSVRPFGALKERAPHYAG